MLDYAADPWINKRPLTAGSMGLLANAWFLREGVRMTDNYLATTKPCTLMAINVYICCAARLFLFPKVAYEIKY